MGENSEISWTDHTFNPWSGCTKVSLGCANCYAEKLGGRFPHLGNWGPGAPRKRTSEANWRKPLAWARKAREERIAFLAGGAQALAGPLRPRVFCASLADWLDPEVPAEWLADLLALIAATPELDWLLLTKRPQLWRERLEAAAVESVEAHMGGEKRGHYLAQGWLKGQAPTNVWLGTSVEDQARADERIIELRRIPSAVRFLSCEPLLGPVDLSKVSAYAQFVNWVIVGGESGAGARPMHPDWARSLRDQCVVSGTSFHFKQWGAWSPTEECALSDGDHAFFPEGPCDASRDAGIRRALKGESGVSMKRVGKKTSGRELDGRTWDEVPRG